jgi:hypothetical protein
MINLNRYISEYQHALKVCNKSKEMTPKEYGIKMQGKRRKR